jgi:hypothetical protein
MLPRLDFMMVWIPAVLVFAARVEDDEVATVGSWKWPRSGLGAWGLGLGASLTPMSRRPTLHNTSLYFAPACFPRTVSIIFRIEFTTRSG